MDLRWPLAVVVVAVLLFAYCTYSVDQSSRSLDRALDSLDQQACYEAGYNAGLDRRAAAERPERQPGLRPLARVRPRGRQADLRCLRGAAGVAA